MIMAKPWHAQSTLIVNAAFTDQDSAPVTPSAASYRVDDVSNDRNIVPLTAISLGAGVTDVDIELTPAQMPINNPGLTIEQHRLTVFFTYGSGRRGNGCYSFEVKRV